MYRYLGDCLISYSIVLSLVVKVNDDRIHIVTACEIPTHTKSV